MGEKDDGLGLSLSLSLGCARNPMPLSSICMQNPQPNNTWNELFRSSDRNMDTRSFLGGIDVNRAATTVDCEEEVGVSSPNSTISSISGKRNERDNAVDETEAERAYCSQASDDENASRKKLRLSKEQSLLLEETFKEHSTLNPKQKLALAKELNLRPRQVEVWFQNRRARTKLKQTEVDCEYLKRCCENLTEENRRLQKEVQDLRALKLTPQLYMHMNPPTTLTMCPSCERVVASSSSVTTSSVAAASSVLATTSAIPNQQRQLPVSPWAAMRTSH
ncbi:Homeobox-leucine zipper protein ATHB-4 [Hibiscus syriacus]|uniref:Homeobox-leucine zipper protein ATHB-4 n=1 Tax=Hibiscus syriacus TaxID=106335 RepID=A0A6A3CN51_HIBSY|nr:homeobox-leucine zipper protein HAT3-like isoform X1 [Hibiscus syriacus]KAE8729022.1 Homeobox-leucine zipper protein ATHB-4 [Hibiscus syriacus]